MTHRKRLRSTQKCFIARLGGQMNKPNFACFDIFDTVLFRAVLAPSDVFRLVYLDLVDLKVLDPIEVDEDAFVAARRGAEDAAKVGVAECTLGQIWNHLALHLGKECHCDLCACLVLILSALCIPCHC